MFYDKGLESKNDALIGMMRVEQRLKDSDTINKFTGIKTLGNLLRSDNEQWNECYKNYLNNTIFHQIKNKSILDIRSEVERFQKLDQIIVVMQFGKYLAFYFIEPSNK